MITVQRQPLIGCLWIKVFNITKDNWTNQLWAKLVLCRVCYVPSLQCAELSYNLLTNTPGHDRQTMVSTDNNRTRKYNLCSDDTSLVSFYPKT